MEKSLFAGLTVLSPDESVLTDDGAFIGRDRETIDRFLEIGAKTHRHNGLPGLDNPQPPLPEVEAIPSGGTIAAGVTFTLGYTLVDGDGGETMLSPTTTVTTPAPLEQPLYAPTAEVDYADGGVLLAETYYYTLTFIDSEGGETPPGAWVQVEREPGFPNARILLSGLAAGVAGASASGWRLYRAVGGGTFDYMASGSATQDSFTDDGLQAVDCDIHPPPDELNTTNNINQLRVVLPSAVPASASGIRLYGTNTGSMLGDVLLNAYPASSAGQTDFFTSYDPQPGAPPDRNHSIGGASKIDPDSEILDWHWKRPVATFDDLPTAVQGSEENDVRLVSDEIAAYGFVGGSWHKLTGGGATSGLIKEVDGPNPLDATFLIDRFDSDTVGNGNWADAELSPAASPQALPVVEDGHLTHADIGTYEFVIDTTTPEIGDQVYTTKYFSGEVPSYVYLMAKLDGPGGTGVGMLVKDGLNMQLFNIDLATAGLNTFVSGDLLAIDPDTDYWLQLSVIGNEMVGNIYDADPETGVDPIHTLSHTLSGPDATAWGAGVEGAVGIGMFSTASTQIQAQTEYLDDVEVTGPEGSRDIARSMEHLAFRASGAAHVGVMASGTSAVVTIHADPSGRQWGSASGLVLASGASGQVDLALADGSRPMRGARMLKLSTSHRVRVRVFGRSADRAAERYPLLDQWNTEQASGMVAPVAPAADTHNLDEPAGSTLYLRIDSFDNAGTVIAAFLMLPTEYP
jgi:hypothetical protein